MVSVGAARQAASPPDKAGADRRGGHHKAAAASTDGDSKPSNASLRPGAHPEATAASDRKPERQRILRCGIRTTSTQHDDAYRFQGPTNSAASARKRRDQRSPSYGLQQSAGSHGVAGYTRRRQPKQQANDTRRLVSARADNSTAHSHEHAGHQHGTAQLVL